MSPALVTVAYTTVQQPDQGFWAGLTAREITTVLGAVATLIVGTIDTTARYFRAGPAEVASVVDRIFQP